MKSLFGTKINFKNFKIEGNAINIIGIICAVLAVFFFVIYGIVSSPKKEELKKFPPVMVPNIYNQELDDTISEFEKIAETPVVVEPTDVGKSNPYF